MEDKNINEILDVFEKGTELNIGIFPNTKIAKYGYEYVNNEFKLYLQGSDEIIDIIKSCIEKNNVAHFNKWASDGRFVTGNGNIKILEKDDEKLDGLNNIIKQHNKNNVKYNIIIKGLEEVLVFEIKVENVYFQKN